MVRFFVAAFLGLALHIQGATIEQLFANVTFLMGSKNGGTGFFIVSNGTRFLVTANHVVEDIADTAYLTVGDPETKKKITIPFRAVRGKANWIRHSNTNVDVAVIPLEIPKNWQFVFGGKFLDETNLIE